MKKPLQRTVSSLLLMTLLVVGQVASAGEREELETLRSTTLNLINALVEQGVLSRDRAELLINKAVTPSKPEAASAERDDKVIRVPLVPQFVRDEIRGQVKNELIAQAKTEGWLAPNRLPDWVERVKVSGDFRMRAERDLFRPACSLTAPAAGCNLDAASYNAITGSSLTNTTEDRTRSLLRARLAVDAMLSDSLDIGMRVATGSLTSPVSTNSTIGNSFNRPVLALDQAYARYHPNDRFKLMAGRMPNPFFSSDLVWNDNLSFDGVAAKVSQPLQPGWTSGLTVGAFPVQDIEPTLATHSNSKWLYAAQIDSAWNLGSDQQYRVGAAIYDFRNVEGRPNGATGIPYFTATAPQFLQKGNSLFNINQANPGATALYGLTSKFREFNLNASADVVWLDPVHVMVGADYVRNIGFNINEISERLGATPTEPSDVTGTVPLQRRNQAYQYRLAIGHPQVRERGQWQTFAGYRHVERDAVMDAFNDSDFHLGGTDAKGYFLGASLGLEHNAWLTLRYMSADPISGPPLSIDVLQMDLNARF